MDKSTDRVDAWLGPTTSSPPPVRAAAEALVRRWAGTAGLDEAGTVELLAMLGLGTINDDGGTAA